MSSAEGKGQEEVFVSEYQNSHTPLSKTHIFWATVKLTWFLIFSIGAVALSVAVAFSSYNVLTSKVALSSLKPHDVIESLSGFFAPNGTVDTNYANYDGFGYPSEDESGLPNYSLFALDVLPYEYKFGMAGICRIYNTSLSTPNLKNTTCTRTLGSPPSILSVVTIDLSNHPAALSNWTSLLAISLISSPSHDAYLSRLSRASSALLLSSIAVTPFVVAITFYLFFRNREHSLPNKLLPLYILDGGCMIASAAMYTHCIETYGVDTEIADGYSFSQGMTLFWVAAAAKMVVTPMMLIVSLVSAMIVVSLGVGGAGQTRTTVETELVPVPGQAVPDFDPFASQGTGPAPTGPDY